MCLNQEEDSIEFIADSQSRFRASWIGAIRHPGHAPKGRTHVPQSRHGGSASRGIPGGAVRRISVALDHADDEAVARLFERVRAEHGRLDILVNNAAKIASAPATGGFWEKPLEAAELITANPTLGGPILDHDSVCSWRTSSHFEFTDKEHQGNHRESKPTNYPEAIHKG